MTKHNGWWLDEGGRVGSVLHDSQKNAGTMYFCDYCERVYCDPVHGLGPTVQEFFEDIPHKICDACFEMEQENDGISWF